MSDYSETFTKVDGNTIEAADFETEFQAIETAIATKADTDSDTLTNLTIGAGYSGSVITAHTSSPFATTSGTAVTVSSIPAWVKRITLSFNGVSTNGTNTIYIQIGDSGGIETSGYDHIYSIVDTAITTGGSTSLWTIAAQMQIDDEWSGHVTITLVDPSNFIYAISGVMTPGINSSNQKTLIVAGNKSLTTILTQLHVKSADTFDSGSFSVTYEG